MASGPSSARTRARGSVLGILALLAGALTVLVALWLMFRSVVGVADPGLLRLYALLLVFFVGIFLLGFGLGRTVQQ